MILSTLSEYITVVNYKTTYLLNSGINMDQVVVIKKKKEKILKFKL